MVRGDGSVHRWRGKWRGVFTDRNGRRRYAYGRTKTEAGRKMRDLRARDEHGTLAAPSRLTLAAWLDEWLAGRRGLAPNTRESYAGAIRNHIAPALGTTKVQKITPRHLRLFLAELEGKALSTRTQALIYTVLCRALGDARRNEILISNPCDLVDKPKPDRFEADTYTADEVRRLLAATRPGTERAMVRMFVSVGLRWGEAAGLKWRDLDLGTGTLTVKRQLVEERTGKGTHLVERPPKRDSVRPIALGAQIVADLRALRVEQATSGKASEYVFVGARGKPWRLSNWTRRVFAPLCERAELRRIRVHDLRHTCATLLMAQGVSPKVVAERLGNDVVITMKTYSHVQAGMQRAAADDLDALLAGGE